MRKLALVGLPLLALFFAKPTFSDNCAVPFSDVVLPSGVTTISVTSSGLNADQATALNNAMGQWNGCGGSVANFSPTTGGELAITVHYNDRQATSSDCGGAKACACFDWNLDWDSNRQKWVIRGGSVEIFKIGPSGIDCDVNSAGSALDYTMTHELGHVLGLDDVSSGCQGRPMRQNGGSVVSVNDCDGAQLAANLADPGSTESEDEFNDDCATGPDGSCSPILIDLDRRGFKLSSWQAGASFDIDADGYRERLGWPTSEDGFLALDRNGNGRIDDGSELFGNFTEQPPSAEPNGYSALAVYDDLWNGGNLDGWISAEDEVFQRLRLWVDAKRNGMTDAGELLPLSVYGIEAISLRYLTARARDRHGNEFRYSAQVTLVTGQTRSTDVFFSTPGSSTSVP